MPNPTFVLIAAIFAYLTSTRFLPLVVRHNMIYPGENKKCSKFVFIPYGSKYAIACHSDCPPCAGEVNCSFYTLSKGNKVVLFVGKCNWLAVSNSIYTLESFQAHFYSGELKKSTK